MADLISGVRYFSSFKNKDSRGSLLKIIGHDEFPELPFLLEEFFVSESSRGVVRGIHYQTGDAASSRVVSVLKGAIFDILVDLRDPSCPSQISQTLSAEEISSVLIPPGVAHGYQVLEDAIVCYFSS